MEEFGEFAEVEGAGLVFVVLFEKFVETAKVGGGLREALLDAVGNFAPFSEGEVEFLGVFALLPGDCAEEGDDVVGYVVLNSGAVTDSVDVAQGRSENTQVGVCNQGVLVVLPIQFVGKCLAKVAPRCEELAMALPNSREWLSLTDASRP